MFTFPKTTWTFSSYSQNQHGDDTEARIEFTSQEETLSELCEKFADFLRASGFSYVEAIVPMTFEEEMAGSGPDTSLDFSEDFNIDTTQLNFDFAVDNVTPIRDYGDVNITYNGTNVNADGISMSSIDSITPEQWDSMSWGSAKKSEN